MSVISYAFFDKFMQRLKGFDVIDVNLFAQSAVIALDFGILSNSASA